MEELAEQATKQMMLVQNRRGSAISTFAFVEDLLTMIIAYSYIPKLGNEADTRYRERERLIQEVLEHKYFSFEFKKALVFKLIDTAQYKKYSGLKKQLDGLPELRNVAAHGAIKVSVNSADGSLGGVYLRRGGKNYPADELFDKFDALSESIQTEIEGLLRQEFGIIVEAVG